MVTRGPSLAHRVGLALILAVYLALALQYALRTPPWQAPDEPAHFNYVAQLVDGSAGPPRIEPGDWDAERLGALVTAGFPEDADLSWVAYEDHQPPAYYYLASLALRLAGVESPLEDRLRALRLLGVGLGALALLLSSAAARAAWPGDEDLALGAAAFVAFLPMQLAMTSSVNNDALAVPLAAAILWLCARRALGGLSARLYALLGGLLLGLALLTKLTLYPAVGFLLAAEALRWWREDRAGGAEGLVATASALGLGALALLPWALRNTRVYGAGDPLGLAAHDGVVAGQPRTSDWIAEHGVAAYARRALVFTFDSFWGVFGWMGVFLDARIYALLALASAATALGALLRGLAAWRARERDRLAALALLALFPLASLAGLVWYNLGYVQHQGRYLLAALPAIALLSMLGARELGRRALRLEIVVAPPSWRAEGGSALGGRLAILAYALAMALLAQLALSRYVVPGLG